MYISFIKVVLILFAFERQSLNQVSQSPLPRDERGDQFFTESEGDPISSVI